MTLPAAVRRQRLDRLRSHSGATRASSMADADTGAAIGMPPAVAAVPGASRAALLAQGVGGHVVGSSTGAVVIVETRVRLPAVLQRLVDLPEPIAADQPIICLDTETTGLGTAAGTVPFLVALGRWQGPEFVVRQLLLPDHPDEAALLDVLERHIPADAALVTYNGRTFDWPLVTSRFRLHGRNPPPLGTHLDLLPLARHVWRHRLSDARLGSVEGVCGVRRHDDLAGALIPERYFAWLRTSDPGLFADVLTHNRQDVVSLALLLRLLAEEVLPERDGRAPSGSVEPYDLAGLGRAYARRGQPGTALICFERALERLTESWRDRESESMVAVERARVLGRLGRRAEAAGAWEAVALEGGRMAPAAWIAVAKSLEHASRDPIGALHVARRADTLAFRLRFLGQPQPHVERDLARRIPRLIRLARTAERPRAGTQSRTMSASVSSVRSTSAAVV